MGIWGWRLKKALGPVTDRYGPPGPGLASWVGPQPPLSTKDPHRSSWYNSQPPSSSRCAGWKLSLSGAGASLKGTWQCPLWVNPKLSKSNIVQSCSFGSQRGEEATVRSWDTWRLPQSQEQRVLALPNRPAWPSCQMLLLQTLAQRLLLDRCSGCRRAAGLTSQWHSGAQRGTQSGEGLQVGRGSCSWNISMRETRFPFLPSKKMHPTPA